MLCANMPIAIVLSGKPHSGVLTHRVRTGVRDSRWEKVSVTSSQVSSEVFLECEAKRIATRNFTAKWPKMSFSMPVKKVGMSVTPVACFAMVFVYRKHVLNNTRARRLMPC